MKIQCLCGCGSLFEQFDKKKRPRKFISGHNSRINNPHKSNPTNKTIFICKFCKKEILEYINKPRNFCSKSCWGKFYGKQGGIASHKFNKNNPPLHKKEKISTSMVL